MNLTMACKRRLSAAPEAWRSVWLHYSDTQDHPLQETLSWYDSRENFVISKISVSRIAICVEQCRSSNFGRSEYADRARLSPEEAPRGSAVRRSMPEDIPLPL